MGWELDTLRDAKGRLITGKILIACAGKNSLSCAAAAYIAKKLLKNNGLASRVEDAKAVIVPECADGIATNFVGRFTASGMGSRSLKGLSKLPKRGAINIFESIIEKELELYAAIKRIKYTKGKSTDLREKIQRLQARYPGTIEALAQSSRQIGEL